MSFREVPTLSSWSNQIFRPFQFPVKVLECVAEIIFLFGNQGRISEPVDSLDEATHHDVSALNRLPLCRVVKEPYRSCSASRFGHSKNVTINAEKVTPCFAQLAELVVPSLQVFGWKLILAPNEIPDQTCQSLTVGIIVPLEIEDWKNGRAIEPEACIDQTIGQ